MLYSFATAQAEEIYREVSQAKTDSIFIAGGPHPSALAEEVLEHFDYVVVGEGEETLPELIQGNIKWQRPDGSDGHRLQNRNGEIRFTKTARSGGSGPLSTLRKDPGTHRDQSRLPLGLCLLPDAASIWPKNASQIDCNYRQICSLPQGYSVSHPPIHWPLARRSMDLGWRRLRRF